MGRRSPRLVVLGCSVLMVCGACRKKLDAADPEFSDALRYLIRDFEAPAAEVAFGLRALETQIAQDMDLDANKSADRALLPEKLTADDVASMNPPNRSIADALPVAVGARAYFPLEKQPQIQLLADHTPVEPFSPEYYVRDFVEGRSCWEENECEFLRTHNDITKENFLMTIDLDFFKDFRWVDLNLPDPSEAEDGEEVVNEGEERWAYMARSWTEETFEGRNGNAWIHQSYSIEVWIPETANQTIRLVSLWSEVEFDGLDFSEDTIIATTQSGIDKNFEAQNDWLESHAR